MLIQFLACERQGCSSMSYSIEQRAKCAAWFECMESVTLVQRKFRAVYGKNIETPSSKTIKKWHTSLMYIQCSEKKFDAGWDLSCSKRKIPTTSLTCVRQMHLLDITLVESSIDVCVCVCVCVAFLAVGTVKIRLAIKVLHRTVCQSLSRLKSPARSNLWTDFQWPTRTSMAISKFNAYDRTLRIWQIRVRNKLWAHKRRRLFGEKRKRWKNSNTLSSFIRLWTSSPKKVILSYEIGIRASSSI